MAVSSEDQAADPALVGVDGELAQCAPGVVANERDIGQIESGEKSVDDRRNAPRAEVGVSFHWNRMRTGRPVGRVAADAAFGGIMVSRPGN